MDSNYPEPPSHVSREAQRAHEGPLGSRQYFGLGSKPVGNTQVPEEPQPDIKRPRACEPCRQLKVRCDADLDHPRGSCKRCAKSGRTCVVTAPSRKRQKKTDTRVTELERKIDALTATLQASHRTALDKDMPSAQAGDLRSLEQSSSRRWLKDDLISTTNKRSHEELLVSQYPRQDSPSAEQLPRPQPPARWLRVSSSDEMPSPKLDNEFVDVIDKGLVDVETASAAFERYVTKFAPGMPFVVFPPGTTMGYIRREKPILFLAILAITIGPFKKEIQLKLLDDVYRLIAERIMVKGEKSLELVQALQVVAIWYQPPDNTEELKFYQLTQFAVIMAMDLGLNWRTGTEDKGLKRLKEVLMRKPMSSSVDTSSPEAKRTWIGCYFLSVQVSTSMRRAQLVRWNPHMDECIRTLETHPDALPSDRTIVWWARLGRIMEEASIQLVSDDVQNTMTFADSKFRYAVKGFSNQLAQWRRDIPEDVYSMPMAHTHHVLNLFVHESAMNVDSRDDHLAMSSESPGSASFHAPLIDAIGTCIHSIHSAFDMICSIEPEKINCLPTNSLARTTFVVVSLIKVYSLIVAPNSHLGQVIDLGSLQIESYLEKIISHYRAAAIRDGGRTAGKFSYIIMMLRNWFLKKRGNEPALREIFGSETPSKPCEQIRKLTQHEATPLHLLSEVAMGNSTNNAPSKSNNTRSPHENVPYRPSTYGHASSPDLNPPLYASAKSLHSPDTSNHSPSTSNQAPSTTTWNPVSPVQTQIPGNPGYYSSYTAPDPNQGYNGIQSSDRPNQLGLGDMSSMNLPMQNQLHLDPGMSMDAGLDSYDLYVLGNMVDEGLFPFPLTFDGNLGAYGMMNAAES